MQERPKRTREVAYFAASNSRDGFHSYYEYCFRNRVDRLFCIKGGPGTGKSTLMRAVAREGERRGYRVEYYYCSSDADSLDGVLLFGPSDSLGLLDATAPHAFEPNIPGAREEILDLGQFWDARRLCVHDADIVTLNRQKMGGYRAAYHLLAAVGEIADALRDAMAPCLHMEKLERTARRLMRSLAVPQTGEVRIRLRDSIGMRGCRQLDTYLYESERLCLIEDYHDSAYALMDILARQAAEQRQSMQISYHPIVPDRIDALLLTASKTGFVVCRSDETATLVERFPHVRVISMRRMTDRQVLRCAREEIRRLSRLQRELTEEACRQLEHVAAAHFSLERIYTEAMDFAAKEAYTAALCRRIFHTE